MKPLLAIGAALLLAACAETGPQNAYYTGPNYPYAAYSTTGVPTTTNGAFAQWPTQQLQERRRELYAEIPRQMLPNGDVAYVQHGQPLPQQDEMKLIEAELNRRYQNGDRAAKLEPFWPESRRRPGSLGG
jgi:hypothetical protein